MAYIEMVHSFKRYHMGDITITANNDVSFGIERGELAIILGSSGAGKSTVLNILGGMDTNSEGKVIIDGVDISDFNAKQLTDYRRNNIGFVFQFYNLVANLTAKENVELASELVKNAADPVQTLVDVGLGGRGPAGHGASATGLGQRRRSPPDRRNCRRHRRNWLKDRTSSPIHGTSWRTAKRSWTRRENNSKQAKPCSTKSARRSANGSRPASPANSTNKYAANTTWRSTSTTKPAPNTTDS